MIRLELLKLAKDSLFEPVTMKREAALQEFHANTKSGQWPTFPTLTDYPSVADIITEAERLRAFVDEKSGS